MTEKPFISIITPSLNRADMIVTAIESVLAQNYPNFEHIIVDGVSTDGTLELLRRYPHLKVHIGYDSGMYDALNRGLELAKGEIIGFLNSDDLYAEEAFVIINEEFQNQPTLAVAGAALIFTTTPNGVSTIGSPYFNAWFFRKSIFQTIGNFITNYKIAADKEFILRFCLSGLKYTKVNKLVYQYRQHTDSMTFDITDQKLERIVDELIFMTSTYLNQKSLPIEARNLIRKLRTRETMEMGVRSIKHDPLWFIRLTRRVIH
jgi:glycosyltransferase involved in cell wall biosynthesis